jgi:hypothetical protein
MRRRECPYHTGPPGNNGEGASIALHNTKSYCAGQNQEYL